MASMMQMLASRLSAKIDVMSILAVGSNCQIIVEELDGVKEVRVNVEAEPGVTGFMVEKALKEALGFSPRGDVYPLEGCPGRRERRRGYFIKRAGSRYYPISAPFFRLPAQHCFWRRQEIQRSPLKFRRFPPIPPGSSSRIPPSPAPPRQRSGPGNAAPQCPHPARRPAAGRL